MKHTVFLFTTNYLLFAGMFCNNVKGQVSAELGREYREFTQTSQQFKKVTSSLFEGMQNKITPSQKFAWQTRDWQYQVDSPIIVVNNNDNYSEKYFRNVPIYNVYLNNAGNLERSIFERLRFKKLYFIEPLNFETSVFAGRTLFEDTFFNNKLTFSNTLFLGNVLLYHVGLGEDVEFNNSTFKSSLRIHDCYFYKRLIFSDCVFLTTPSFNKVRLPLNLYLKNVDLSKIERNIDFIGALPPAHGMKCKILLEGTDVSKLLLDYSLFEIDTTNHPTIDQLRGTYEQIIKNCRDKGLTESAKGFDIELQRIIINQKLGQYSSSAAKLWTLLQKYWWNFGYDQYWILASMGLFFLGFCLINWCFLDKMIKNVYFDRKLGAAFLNDSSTSLETPDQLINKLDTSTKRFLYALHYTGVIYFGFRVDHEALSLNNLLGSIYFYIIYLTGIIHLAYSASYIVGDRLL